MLESTSIVFIIMSSEEDMKWLRNEIRRFLIQFTKILNKNNTEMNTVFLKNKQLIYSAL